MKTYANSTELSTHADRAAAITRSEFDRFYTHPATDNFVDARDRRHPDVIDGTATA